MCYISECTAQEYAQNEIHSKVWMLQQVLSTSCHSTTHAIRVSYSRSSTLCNEKIPVFTQQNWMYLFIRTLKWNKALKLDITHALILLIIILATCHRVFGICEYKI